MRKNVLIFGHDDAPQFIDIYNQYTCLFDKNKYKVMVVYLTGDAKEEAKEKTIAEEVVFLNMSKKSIRGLKLAAIWKMLCICRKEKFEIVICHRYKPTYIMLWLAKLCKIPVLFFVMHELKTMSSRGRRLLIALLQQKNMLFAGVSNAVRDDLRGDLTFLPKERVITLYNMIDLELTEPKLFCREEARATLGLSNHDFIFGNIARLVANKDQKTLLNAFAFIKLACPKAKLILMGTGKLEAELKAQTAALGLTNEVIFAGFVSQAFRYMRALDCFVLSSTQEAFGRVLLEAMIAQLPIIATRTNGIPEVMGNEGTLVAASDAKQLAEAMQHHYHLSAAQREALGKDLYQWVSHEFSVQKFQQIFWQLSIMQTLTD